MFQVFLISFNIYEYLSSSRNRKYFSVLELGGNLIDVCGIGIYTALKNTTLPRLEIERGDNNEVEIQLTDDPLDTIEIDSLSPILTCTIGKILQNIIIST